MATTHIPLFKNSNDLLRAIGFPHKSHIANFDVYSIESLSASTKEYMPPYRQDFYQIGLLNYVGDSRLSLDSSDLDVDEYSLWFVVPGQVFSWVRDPNIKGINILFKKEFISGLVSDFREEFPFLNTTENKVLKLSKNEYKILLTDIERIKSIYSTEFPYQKNMLQGVLFSFLYFTKGIFERVKSKQTHFTRGQVITQKFEILLDNMYLQTKNVSDYAEALNITSNYLTTVIKRVTGKSAKDLILNRILIESKNLLRYTKADISEIAYKLNFKETTHFTRFFKSLTGITPNGYRKKLR